MAYDGEIKELSIEEVDAVSGGVFVAVLVAIGLYAAYKAGEHDGTADKCG